MKNKNKTIYCDVDDTLIRTIENGEDADISFKYQNIFYGKKINYELIKYLKEKSDSGYYIILWTSNPLGYEWAKFIKKILKLSFIDLCLFKPTEIIDDCPLNEISHFTFKKPNIF